VTEISQEVGTYALKVLEKGGRRIKSIAVMAIRQCTDRMEEYSRSLSLFVWWIHLHFNLDDHLTAATLH
jgi:hypothetical protein